MNERYRLEVVGGPFDGVQGFFWNDDGEHPPPGHIFVGVCDGQRCSFECRGQRKHVSFWVEDEPRPVATMRYDKTDVGSDDGSIPGLLRATYAMGSFDVLTTRSERELVPA